MAAEDIEINLGDFERQLCMVPKVNVFRVPALKQADGYRCTGWEGNQCWAGRIRVLVKGNKPRIVLDDTQTGNIFAEAPLDHPNAIEPVLDSSRYFVIRVVQGTRHAFIGVGFDERNDAFDFKLQCSEAVKAAQEYERQQSAPQTGPVPITSSGHDYSLHGQKITINMPGGVRERKKRTTNGAFKL